MNSKSEDEDYWHASDSKAFSFDEEEFSYKSSLFDSGIGGGTKSFHDNLGGVSTITDLIFQGIPTVKKSDSIKRPLASLISKNSLSIILGEDSSPVLRHQSLDEEVRYLRKQLENRRIPVPPAKTVKLIMIGRPYTFHFYRSLEEKKELLNEAVKTGDGNAILAVVLFLSKTLKKSIFYQILQENPTAVTQYVNFLSTRRLIPDLIDLLAMLGQAKEAAARQFKVAVQDTQNMDIKLRKLNSCYQNHFSTSELKDKQFLASYIKYLEWVISVSGVAKGMPSNSTLSSLTYLCKNYWTEPKTSSLSPMFLAAQQGINDRQFQWTVLSARATLQAWDDLEAFFFTKGWIGGKKLKSVFSIEKAIRELHKLGAPNSVLAQYFAVIDNLEERLTLSRQLSCHTVTVDIYVAMKDRQGLIEFKANLKPQSEDYLYAEVALKSPVKWKN